MDPQKLLDDCQVRRHRASGPGGQHRNKVETAVVVTHLATGVTGEASERRSQEQNRRRALHRLRVNLALQVRQLAAGSGASPAWKRHLRATKIAIGGNHVDFPAMLAEALDVLHTELMDVRRSSERLGCTTSQLVKLLQAEPRAFDQVNAFRKEAGLHRLR